MNERIRYLLQIYCVLESVTIFTNIYFGLRFICIYHCCSIWGVAVSAIRGSSVRMTNSQYCMLKTNQSINIQNSKTIQRK